MTDVTTVISTVAPVAEGEFRIGRVFSRTLTLLSRNFPIYFVVAAVAALPSVVVETTVSAQKAAFSAPFLAVLAMLVLTPLSQAITLHTAFQDMSGRRINLSESFRAALGRWLPLIGLSICVGFGVMLGLILLIVPGIILMIMWYVAYPACIVERLGVFASMARTSELTKGHRWSIFGMWVLVAIASGVMGAVVKGVLGLSGSTGLVICGTLAWTALATAFGAVLTVATYHDLRVAKEGVDTRHIVAVFD
jgi:uncharacterized membrane protein